MYNLSTNIAAFAQLGINVFKGKSNYGDAGNILNLPLLAGIRFKSDGFFVGAGVGYGKFSSQVGLPPSGLMYSPQIGYVAANANTPSLFPVCYDRAMFLLHGCCYHYLSMCVAKLCRTRYYQLHASGMECFTGLSAGK